MVDLTKLLNQPKTTIRVDYTYRCERCGNEGDYVRKLEDHLRFCTAYNKSGRICRGPLTLISECSYPVK